MYILYLVAIGHSQIEWVECKISISVFQFFDKKHRIICIQGDSVHQFQGCSFFTFSIFVVAALAQDITRKCLVKSFDLIAAFLSCLIYERVCIIHTPCYERVAGLGYTHHYLNVPTPYLIITHNYQFSFIRQSKNYLYYQTQVKYPRK